MSIYALCNFSIFAYDLKYAIRVSVTFWSPRRKEERVICPLTTLFSRKNEVSFEDFSWDMSYVHKKTHTTGVIATKTATYTETVNKRRNEDSPLLTC